MDESVNVYDIQGLLQYLTLYDINAKQKNCSGSTYFPHGAKILSSNYKEMSKCRELEISEDLKDYLLDYAYKEYYTNNGPLVKEDWHSYLDKSEDKLKICIDKYYIRVSEDFVLNVFGTEEDDKILEQIKNNIQ